jgi:hypothetical protein
MRSEPTAGLPNEALRANDRYRIRKVDAPQALAHPPYQLMDLLAAKRREMPGLLGRISKAEQLQHQQLAST